MHSLANFCLIFKNVSINFITKANIIKSRKLNILLSIDMIDAGKGVLQLSMIFFGQ